MIIEWRNLYGLHKRGLTAKAKKTNITWKLAGVDMSHVIEVGARWAHSADYHNEHSCMECAPDHHTLYLATSWKSLPQMSKIWKTKSNMRVKEKTRDLDCYAF